MPMIDSFEFNTDVVEKVKNLEMGKNWPIVYLIEDNKEIYIGQSFHAYIRTKDHLKNPERAKLHRIHVISDSEYHLSATTDIESSLIQYTAADGRYILQNSNRGIGAHNYYDKPRYQAKFETIWDELLRLKLVDKPLNVIKNSELFKYSPYKSLTPEQEDILLQLLQEIKVGKTNTYIVEGGPGTGKTILATHLFKYLKEQESTKNLEIGLVVPMTSLRSSIKSVFKNIRGLSAGMVIGPGDVTKKKYDILLVDEAHRLKRRKNIANYQSFDNTNKLLGLDESGNELDWIINSSRLRILFYDLNQSVRPTDIRPESFQFANAKSFLLKQQMRIGGGNNGDSYIELIDSLLDNTTTKPVKLQGYDFKIYDNIERLVKDIKSLNEKYGLARMVSGYAWEWKSQHDKDVPDIEIGDTKLFWNSKTKNWVNSDNAINEVGCIHTVQGYDLNFAGVIIGPEFSYDFERNSFVINVENYKDINGRRGVESPAELERYIINIYKTLLTRGIMGTYIYIVDDNLRKYFHMKTQKQLIYV